MKKMFMLLMVLAISLFSFTMEADAKVLANYDINRGRVTDYVPQPSAIFTFAVVGPRQVTIHRSDLRQFIEAECLAPNEFIVVKNKDMASIRRELNRYYYIKSHGLYNYKCNYKVRNFVAKYDLSNVIKVSFLDRH